MGIFASVEDSPGQPSCSCLGTAPPSLTLGGKYLPSFCDTYLLSIFLPRTKLISPVPNPVSGEDEVWRFSNRGGRGEAAGGGRAKHHGLKV